ncbi:MAG: hypothetical protein U0441_23150 [Polyangiaceae bacterium]
MSDFAGELMVVGASLVSPLATTPSAHAFLAKAGATPAAATLSGPMKGAFACPWIPEESSLGVRLAVLASQALAALLSALPETVRVRADIEVVIAFPNEAQGFTEDDTWLVERSARTALHGTRATLAMPTARTRGPRAAFDEVLRAGRDLSQDALRLIVAVDSLAHPERAKTAPDDRDSPWDPAPPRRSEAASGLLLATPARVAEARLPIWGRLRGAATRVHDSTPDNDHPSDGTAISGAIRALPGGSKFVLIAGPEPLSGFYRDELAVAVARNSDRFQPVHHALGPAALLGDVGIASLPASIALVLATLRHGTLRRLAAAGAQAPDAGDLGEHDGPALIWDLFADGTRVALTLEASLDPPPAHRAACTLDSLVAADVLVQKATPTSSFAEPEEGCLERLLSLCRLRKQAPWRELPRIEERILANLDALAETGVSFSEACQFLASRGDPYGGVAATFLFGALRQKGAEGAAVFEDTMVALFGPGAEIRLDAGDSTLETLWLASEGLFLFPSAVAEQALLGSIDQGRGVMAAIALVTLARRGLMSPARVGQRLSRGEPLFAAAVARAASLSPELIAHKESWRPLLDAPGPLAWEGARALLLTNDEAPLARLRAGDELADRLGEKALCLLALAGHEPDVPLFARLARRLPRTETTLRATGDFGWMPVASLLLSALDDEATVDAAARALSTMFGPLPQWPERTSRVAWGRAMKQATWARDKRARDGKPWSAKAIASPRDPSGISDREWQFRIDELRLVSKKVICVEPGGFGAGAREAMLATIAMEERGIE